MTCLHSSGSRSTGRTIVIALSTSMLSPVHAGAVLESTQGVDEMRSRPSTKIPDQSSTKNEQSTFQTLPSIGLVRMRWRLINLPADYWQRPTIGDPSFRSDSLNKEGS